MKSLRFVNLGRLGVRRDIGYQIRIRPMRRTSTFINLDTRLPIKPKEAMTSVLRSWVSRQNQGTPPRSFRESTRKGQLKGKVTAGEIPFHPEGRTTHTSRYSHLRHSAFGPGYTSKMDLRTTLIDPFEIEVEYAVLTCLIWRIVIYQRITGVADLNWAVHTFSRPGARKTPPSP
jgi:hypothetical protein